MAAGRAGYSRIYFLARDRAGPPGITAISNWSSLADAFARQPGPLIIAHAAILAEPEWLARLVDTQPAPATWAAIPHKMIVLAAAAVADAIVALEADKGAYDLTAAQQRLTQRFGAPVAIPAAIDPLVVMTLADVDDAEWRLLRRTRQGHRRVHGAARRAADFAANCPPSGVHWYHAKPNHLTLGWHRPVRRALFLSPYWLWQTVGALLFLAHSILDGCDGELARLKFQESRFGGIIDYWGDNVVHIAVFACMAVGWCLSIGEHGHYCLASRQALGNLGSAWFVYWRVMRPKNTMVRFLPQLRLFPARPSHECLMPLRAAILSTSCSFLLCSGSRTGFSSLPLPAHRYFYCYCYSLRCANASRRA